MNRLGGPIVTKDPARAFLLPLLAAVVILSGCVSSSPAQSNFTAEADAAVDIDVPGPEEICLMPDDGSGITVYFAQAHGHAPWRLKPGWTVAYLAGEVLVRIEFPRPVDPSSVRVRVEPESWRIEAHEYSGAPESSFFRLLPDANADPADWIGWVTLTVEQAIAADGGSFEGVPFSVRFFAFDHHLAEAHPHLTECMTRFVVHEP